ncbi:MAG: hypothetical protein KC492_40775, partial [Myxococcales bacterium]|nr:hypothetical protein [Myxococcales bacterium]
RIEMHQIGVRDGARMLGGIGPCGRELCCSTFLEHFAPVSIRMAKEQGLTLNPKKVSGMCGRLMCCLVYEQQLYKKNRRRLPRPRQQVTTEQGEGIILSVDVINERLLVELEDTNRKTFALHEVILHGSQSADVVDEDAADLREEYLWGVELETTPAPTTPARSDDDSDASESATKKRRRRRRRRPGGGPGGASES